MATAPSPNDLTRQQLDELDALLQRMLAIPLNPSEPAPPPPEPPPSLRAPTAPVRPIPTQNWRVDSPPTTSNPAPHVIPMPAASPMSMPAQAEPPRPRPEPERFVPPEPISHAMPEPQRPVPMPEVPVPPTEDEFPDTVPFESTSIPVQSHGSAPRPDQEPFAFPFRAPISPTASAPQPLSDEPEDQPIPARPEPRRQVSVMAWPFVALNYVIDGTLNITGVPGRIITSWPVKTLLGLSGLGMIVYTAAYFAQQKGLIQLPQPLPWPQ